MSNRVLPERVILTIGEIKRIGIYKEFCESEGFNENGVISGVSKDSLFSLESKLLPKNYSYGISKKGGD